MRFRTVTFVVLLLCQTLVHADYSMYFMNNTHHSVTLMSVCDDKLSSQTCHIDNNGRLEPFKRVQTHSMNYARGVMPNHRFTLITYFSMPGDKKEVRSNYLSTVFEGDYAGSHIVEVNINIDGIHHPLLKADKLTRTVMPNEVGALNYQNCDGNEYTFYANVQSGLLNNQKMDKIYFAIDKKPALLSSEKDGELTVISYNIGAYPKNMNLGMGLNKLSDRVHYLSTSPALRKADLLVLQAAWDDNSRDVIKNLMHDAYPYSYDPVPENTHGKRLNSGLLILSRYPITRQMFINYQDHQSLVNIDSNTNKGAAYIKVDKNGQPYNLIATHFQGASDEKSATVREDEFHIIKQQVLESKELAIPAHEPLLFAATTNVSYYDKAAFKVMESVLQLDPSTINNTLFQSPKFSYDANVNLMAKFGTYRFGLYDMVLPIKGFKAPAKSVSQVTPLRALDSNSMYERPLNYMIDNDGDVELSSHFMVQAKFIY